MTARTYTAAEMRDGYLEGYDDGHKAPDLRDEAEAYALTRWPDPPPEPPAMAVREEPDPEDNAFLWRWQPARGFGLECRYLDDPWSATTFLRTDAPARLALWADLAAYPMRLPDGRPCTLTGEAKP